MTFSSLVFLCIFLPIVFCLHSLIHSIKVKNALLIVASLVFYAYGEPVYVLLMIGSAFLNYVFALLMQKETRKGVLILAITANIGILCAFKYMGFLMITINHVFRVELPVPEIALPIGISFFTFQALSYVIDAYRRQTDVQKSFFKVLLYISFFPQLIAGPIVKYRDIAAEIDSRCVDVDNAVQGMQRFITGLAKKVLIANAMAVVADNIFDNGYASANILVAWIGAIAYVMQIYFDFSGYSDMAIGMGRMFGFHFRENFQLPYASRTIREFWRRWHISLSSWFRDYVYIPLGGNRKGHIRTGINKVLVFFLTGLWHGANWTFVVWGLFHGIFSFFEEAIPSLQKLPRVVLHIYTMLVVTVGFVIFRADTLTEAVGFIGRMFGGFDFSNVYLSFALQQMTPYFLVMLAAAVFFCGPVGSIIDRVRVQSKGKDAAVREKGVLQVISYAVFFALLLWCLIRLSGGSYNPFIYFRF